MYRQTQKMKIEDTQIASIYELSRAKIKLITLKSIMGLFLDSKLSRFGLAGSAIVAILEF